MKTAPVAIVDYQLCNLFSVEHACKSAGIPTVITSDPNTIRQCPGIILPGVGAFADAMKNIRQLGLDVALRDSIAHKVPVLGICLGLQLLFEESEEFGTCMGLGILPGRVRRIPSSIATPRRRIPHMGWNPIHLQSHTNSILTSADEGRSFYFVHSYVVHPDNPAVVASTTEFDGFEFCSSVSQGNLFACQFHPEKSGREGLSIYRNWYALTHTPGEIHEPT